MDQTVESPESVGQATGWRETLRPGQRVGAALQARLDELARPAAPELREVVTAVLRRPAKRLRPALLLAAASSGGDSDAALSCAAAVEAIHQSSIVHDDLMDGTDRRGQMLTAHRRYGLGLAVVAGDYLVAAAGDALCGVGAEAARVGLHAYREMCVAQARETAGAYRIGTVEEHLDVVRGKTGALLRAACVLGARAGGLDEVRVRAFGAFGLAFGVVFQLVDDLVDLLSTPELCQKQVGQDLPNGTYTLPVLLAARRHGRALVARLGPGRDRRTLDEARVLVCDPAVLAEAFSYAVEYAAVARCSLPGHPLAELPADYLRDTLPSMVAPARRPMVESLLAAAELG
ncbi:polyprenyl synthetase family protein [Micromonosporaceae bacterium B7E4]